MQWKIKPTPYYNEKRSIKKFAWFPKKTHTHWVWLEHYYSLQKYSRLIGHNDITGLPCSISDWVEIKAQTKQEFQKDKPSKSISGCY
jgi:spore germination protein YaaH